MNKRVLYFVAMFIGTMIKIHLCGHLARVVVLSINLLILGIHLLILGIHLLILIT